MVFKLNSFQRSNFNSSEISLRSGDDGNFYPSRKNSSVGGSSLSTTRSPLPPPSRTASVTSGLGRSPSMSSALDHTDTKQIIGGGRKKTAKRRPEMSIPEVEPTCCGTCNILWMNIFAVLRKERKAAALLTIYQYCLKTQSLRRNQSVSCPKKIHKSMPEFILFPVLLHLSCAWDWLIIWRHSKRSISVLSKFHRTRSLNDCWMRMVKFWASLRVLRPINLLILFFSRV